MTLLISRQRGGQQHSLYHPEPEPITAVAVICFSECWKLCLEGVTCIDSQHAHKKEGNLNFHQEGKDCRKILYEKLGVVVNPHSRKSSVHS